MLKSLFFSNKNLVVSVVLIYLFRLLIIWNMGIMPQDAYYYLYSQHLALSYYDHPPMVAYMLKVFTTLLGKSVFVLKFADFTISLLSFLSFYYLASCFLSQKKAFFSMLFYGATLQLTLISINTTPDVPLLLFWTLSLLAIYKAFFKEKWIWWAISGVLIGLAFNSKYTGVFLIFGMLLFIISSKKYWRLFFSKRGLLLLVCFFITIAPVVFWNMENHWISFSFQSSERVGEISKFILKPKLFFGNLGVQLLVLIPFLFAGIIFVFYKLLRKMLRKRCFLEGKTHFLLAFSLPIIGFFFLISPFYWIKMNWILPGYIAAILLACIYLNKKLLFYQVGFSLIVHLLLFIQIYFYIINIKSDDTWLGWKTLATKVKVICKKYPDAFVFSADGYKTTSVLNFYMDKPIFSGNIIGKNGLQYSLLDSNLDYLSGRDAIYIDSESHFKNLLKSGKIPSELKSYFDEIIELPPITIGEKGQYPKRKFLVFRGIRYKLPTAKKGS